ncbi:hypothetical protein KGQ64_13760 [bacterium]|nr:hypothetical protein [bacterium]
MSDARPGPVDGGRGSASDAAPTPDPGWGPALALGVVYAALVVALLLLARAGAGFIYQGF